MYKFEIQGESIEEIKPFVKALDLVAALDNYSNFLRTRIKYGDLDEKIEEVYIDCREEFLNILISHGVQDMS